MIRQKIDPLKFINSLLDLNRADPDKPRMSLIDGQVLLYINESPDSGKNDILEKINGATTSKSFLDRPVDRLLKYELISSSYNEHANTKDGQSRVSYAISEKGREFLKNCAYDQ